MQALDAAWTPELLVRGLIAFNSIPLLRKLQERLNEKASEFTYSQVVDLFAWAVKHPRGISGELVESFTDVISEKVLFLRVILCMG